MVSVQIYSHDNSNLWNYDKVYYKFDVMSLLHENGVYSLPQAPPLLLYVTNVPMNNHEGCQAIPNVVFQKGRSQAHVRLQS
jgi:hypothetical protein